MKDIGWLTARPIAHRGFHDAANGRVENTMSAFAAAAARGFNIELDVHLSADGTVFVFHDDDLGRLTHGTGPVAGRSYDDLAAIAFRATADRMPKLSDVLDLIAGRVGLIVELKSYFAERQRDIVEATARVLSTYGGPVVVKSFDPREIEDLAEIAPELPRGIVADDCSTPEDYNDFRFVGKDTLANLDHFSWSKPDFVSYWVKLLPNAVSRRVREEWKLPLISWTVRDATDRASVAAHADQMIFEGFDPEAV
jgi:glycerophosphoryl diester phosphodiesterase